MTRAYRAVCTTKSPATRRSASNKLCVGWMCRDVRQVQHQKMKKPYLGEILLFCAVSGKPCHGSALRRSFQKALKSSNSVNDEVFILHRLDNRFVLAGESLRWLDCLICIAKVPNLHQFCKRLSQADAHWAKLRECDPFPNLSTGTGFVQ